MHASLEAGSSVQPHLRLFNHVCGSPTACTLRLADMSRQSLGQAGTANDKTQRRTSMYRGTRDV